MPKLIMLIDGIVSREIELTKDRTTMGRRPYNDIVIDDLTVSGEHAVLHTVADGVYLEDLNSTNGTYVNDQIVKKQRLRHGDLVAIGKYQLKFVQAATSESSVLPSGLAADAGAPVALSAVIKVVSGALAGRELPLTKVVTTIGIPGVAIATISRRALGFEIQHVEGVVHPALNGKPIGAVPVRLKSGDLIELAGTQMQFVQT
jgi:hypothetical protein